MQVRAMDVCECGSASLRSCVCVFDYSQPSFSFIFSQCDPSQCIRTFDALNVQAPTTSPHTHARAHTHCVVQGKIKVKGNMALAMKLNTVMAAAKPKSKL